MADTVRPAVGEPWSGLTEAWVSRTTEKLGNLATSNKDIMKIVIDASGEKGSEAKLQLVTTLLGQRSNRALAVSNVMKDLLDTMRRIIGNIV